MANWEEEIELPKNPDDEYAYIVEGSTKAVFCDKETLFKKIQTDGDIKFVTTPELDHFIIPGTNYETLEPILEGRKAGAKSNLKSGTIITLIGTVILIYLRNKDVSEITGLISSGKIYFVIFGIIPLLNSAYEMWALRRINVSNFDREVKEIRFNFWLRNQENSVIKIIVGILGGITFIQIFTGLGDSILAAGLVKPKTLEGEYWRLLTATLLHGNVIHIIFNGAAMYSIGRMLINITSIWHFFIVFLISGIIGSLFSLFLIPDVTSVGASGGILGLIGFILVMSIKLKSIPRNIVKSMIYPIIYIIILGFAAYNIIDNAGHAGGLVGGILLGLILIRKNKELIPYKASKTVVVFGALSLLTLLGGVLLIVVKILQ